MSAFRCVICERTIEMGRHFDERRRQFPPVCFDCESPMAHSGYGSRRVTGSRVTEGTHLDRRMARRVFALADAIETLARHIEWKGKAHGASRL